MFTEKKPLRREENFKRFTLLVLILIPPAIFLQNVYWWGALVVYMASPLAFIFLNRMKDGTSGKFSKTNMGAIIITLFILTLYVTVIINDIKPLHGGDVPAYSSYAYGLLDPEIFKGDELMPYGYQTYSNHNYFFHNQSSFLKHL